jgi:lipoyl synthase
MSTTSEGRKLLRLEVRNSETPIERKPPWIRTEARTRPAVHRARVTRALRRAHTVCEEAGCPNIDVCRSTALSSWIRRTVSA